MLNKSGYLYFYAEDGDFSQILHLSTLCASVVLQKVYLCVNKKYFNFYLKHNNLPPNVSLHCIDDCDLYSPTLDRIDKLYQSGSIRSNCPAIERHCINRWLYLKGKSMFGESSLISFDWDTFIFPGLAAHNSHLNGIDLGATNLMSLGWDPAPKEPIWSLCPNLLYFSSLSLDLYIYYLEIYIARCEKFGSIVNDFFCDMQPWSSVISSSLAGKRNLKLLNFNDIVDDTCLVDHNVRILYDCGLNFKEMRYYFQTGSPTYLETPYLPAKHIVFSDYDRPFFVIEANASSRSPINSPPVLKEVAAIHFSGVEGKHLLLQTFKENIFKYLQRNLGTRPF